MCKKLMTQEEAAVQDAIHEEARQRVKEREDKELAEHYEQENPPTLEDDICPPYPDVYSTNLDRKTDCDGCGEIITGHDAAVWVETLVLCKACNKGD